MSYNSNSEAKAQGQLSPEDQAVLDQLIESNKPTTKFVISVEAQRLLLAGLYQHPEFLPDLAPFIKKDWFDQEAHQLIYKIIVDFWQKYRAVPARAIVENEIDQATAKKDDDTRDTIRIIIKGEFNVIRHIERPEIQDICYLRDQVTLFAKVKAAYQGMNEIIDDLKNNKATWEKKLDELPRKVEQIGLRSVQDPLLSWTELKKIAADQSDDWLIEGLVEAGGMYLLSGQPFSGKTVLLDNMIAAVAAQSDFLGRAVMRQFPIIYIDADQNKERTKVNRILRALPPGDELAELELEKLFKMAKSESIPYPVPASYVERLIRVAREKITEVSTATGVVIIDTLRSAFMSALESNAENDSAAIVKVLLPIKQLTRETGWTVIIPHHNNRGRDTFAGSGAILQLLNGYWNYQREDYDDPTNRNATLAVRCREDEYNCIYHTRLTETGLELTGDSDSGVTPKDTDLERFINLWPVMAAEAKTLQEVLAENPGFLAAVSWTLGTAKNKLKEAQAPGRQPRLERHPDDKQGSHRVRFFRV